MNVPYVGLLLCVAVLQADAMGKCNNSVIKAILDTNDFCPAEKSMLQYMWELGGAVSFRVLTKKYYDKCSCVTGVIEKPKNNVAILHNKFTFRNTSRTPSYVRYVMADSTCGLNYKHDVERNYLLFKIAFGYFDGITIGYYGCTDETTKWLDLEEQYAQCYTALSTTTTPEIEQSLANCKKRMEAIVPGSEMVMIPPCNNDNKYLTSGQKTKIAKKIR